MLNAPKILSNVTSSLFEGLGVDVRDFLTVASSESNNLGHNEKRLYQNFITNFLHAIVLKLKAIENDSWLREILVATTACCEAYVSLQDGTSDDKNLAVPKLVYNIVISLKKQDYLEDVICVTGLLYRMLDPGAGASLVGQQAHTVIRAVASYFWGMAAKLARQKNTDPGAPTDLGLHVQLWRGYFDFLCLLPDRATMIDKLRTIFSDFLPTATSLSSDNSLKLDTDCSQLICSIFESLITKMTGFLQHNDNLEEKSSLAYHISQVRVLYVEHLVRQCDTAGARQVVEELSEDQVEVAAVYHVCLDLLAGSTKYEALADTLRNANEETQAGLQLYDQNKPKPGDTLVQCDQDKLRLLYWTYSHFTKLSRLDAVLSECKCKQFVEQVLVAHDVCLAVSMKMIDLCSLADGSYKKASDTQDKKSGQNKKSGQDKTTDEDKAAQDKKYGDSKLVVGLLKTYLRELQIILQVLRSGDSCSSVEELLQRGLVLVKEFGGWLEKESSSLPAKVVAGHRHNCGWACSSLGNYSFRQSLYEISAQFYQQTVNQLQHCNEPRLFKFLESTMECYLQLDRLTEASQVVIQALALTTPPGAGSEVGPSLMLWYRLKKEAITRGNAMFLTMSLASMVHGAGVTVPGLTSKQLLYAEYQTCRKAARRNLVVEYHLLVELCEATSGDLGRAVVMVDLAANMRHTGYKYRDNTAGELLNKAIINLDKHTDKAGAALALAFYTKYDVTHNLIIQEQEKQEKPTAAANPNEPTQDTVESESQEAAPRKPDTTTRFTLQSEQPYLPYLRRAVELWEAWFTAGGGGGASGGRGKKKVSSGGEDGGIQVDVEHHLAALMECATRLILMKQPMLGLRAVRVAQGQLASIAAGAQHDSLHQQMARLWLLLGCYTEAQGIILPAAARDQQSAGTGVGSKEGQPVLLAELCLMSGKKEEGVDILSQLLTRRDSNGTGPLMTPQSYLQDGTAKRLLSTLLCYPDSHQGSGPAHQYLLSLAFEAVRSHISVLKSLVKNDTHDKFKTASTDKWLLLYEVLQSLLHLCQLCRFVGMPSDAQSYLREGLAISQAHGLPRWSCEFLFELLRVQSLVGDYEMALQTVDFIYSVLESSGDQTCLGTSNNCASSESHEMISDPCPHPPQQKPEDNKAGSHVASGGSVEDCFGFENMDPVAKKTNVTPEKECYTQKLNSVCKKRISGLSAPKCGCVLGEEACKDSVRHKLCVQAGIVVADFLAQADMRPVAERLLHHSKNTVSLISNEKSSNSLVDVILQHSSPASTNGRLPDAQIVYMCLEAICIEAEIYMHQNNYGAVHQIWTALSEVQTAGYLKNILHSNIAMTRLALCQVNAYMRSLNTTHITAIADSVMEPLTEKVQQLSLTEKKVSFSDTKELCVNGTKLKGARRKLLGSSEGMSDDNPIDLCSDTNEGRPSLDATRGMSGCIEAVSTPKASRTALMQLGSKSARKERLSHMLQTPVTNRRAVLDLMIDSDEEDDAHIMFPKPKLVTPKVDKNKEVKSRRCKTEPRNKSRNTKPEPVLPMNPACKLDDLLENSVVSPTPEIGGCINNNATESSEKLDKDCKMSNLEKDNPQNSEIGNGKLAVEGHKVKLAEKPAGKGRGRKTAASSLTPEEPDPFIEGENDKTAGRGRGRKTYARKPGKKTDNKIKTKLEEVIEVPSGEVVEVLPEITDISEINDMLKETGTLNKKNEAETVDPEFSSGTKRSNIPVKTAVKREGNSCRDSSKKVIPLKPSIATNLPNPTVNGDVFDFNAQASPDVGKVVKSKAKKTKQTSSSLTKTVSSSVKTKQSTKAVGKGKENVSSAEKKPARPRRGRAKKEDDVIELQRNSHNDSVNQLDISYDEIPDDECNGLIDKKREKAAMFDSLSLEIEYQNAQNCLSESEIHTDLELELPDDEEYEPIEVMRSDTATKSKQKTTRGGKRATRGRQAAARRRSSVEDGEGSVAGAEVMRSGCPVSLDLLAQKLACGEEAEELPEVPRVTAGGDSGLDQSAMMASLELMYGQIRHLAWYPQHPELCQALALHYIDTQPARAAFLLSDSIAVTFRHQAMLNVGRKVRKATEQKTGNSGDEGLACIQDGLLFDKDETCLTDMISVIPHDWVVVQLSVVSTGAAVSGQQFLLTRFVSGQSPLVVRLPGLSTPQGRQILRDFSQIMESNVSSVKIESRAKWWNTREKLNLDLQTLIENMEKFWLGAWMAAFLPRGFSQKLVTKVARDVKKTAKKDIDTALVEMLLLCACRVSDPQLVQCVQELLSSSWSLDDINTVVTVVRRHATPDITDTSQHHLVLILDKTVQHLPWENLPSLSEVSVSRMPCLPHLYTVLTYLQAQESSTSTSVYHHGVDPRSTYYIINPDLDLPHLEKTFKDWFEGEEGWKGTCGVKPTSEQFTEALTQRDLLIYCGHGSGGRYFGRDEIERLRARAVTLLMGCSSGKLRAKGILEPSGIMLSYFMAGCPCMVANLWDVTDKDIDKFTYDLLHTWLSADDGARLSDQVQRSRAACKMRYLVGSAPVVYGLPVFINRKR